MWLMCLRYGRPHRLDNKNFFINVLLLVQTHTSINTVGDGSDEMATALFEYSGELGDTNALYTFAQLLRTGR